MGFDFSDDVITKRKSLIGGSSLHVFDIARQEGNFQFSLEGTSAMMPAGDLSLLHQHLLLKMLLNIHSTLVMGKMGRYESNLMTFVRASNNKLIDRAARYIMILLERSGVRVSYKEVIYAMFELMNSGSEPGGRRADTDAIVLSTCTYLRR